MELPINLRIALDTELDNISSKKLADIAGDLSKRYRSTSSNKGESFIRSKEDTIAYAAFRLPATYAAVVATLENLQNQLPHWNPTRLMDVGAGPGTAMWAATTLWSSIETITLIERETDMISLGKRLSSHSVLKAVKEAEWKKIDLTGSWEVSSQDLITASYSLGELSQENFTGILKKLWGMTSGVLVIIEPGTPAGFNRIREARHQLIEEGATIIGPCPHNNNCPMEGDNWCHFSQRVARSRLHRQVKSGDLSYEDEKYSFIIASKIKVEGNYSRIIRHPLIRKGHIQLETCSPEGLESIVVTRKNKELYKKAKDLHWGATFSPEVGNKEIE